MSPSRSRPPRSAEAASRTSAAEVEIARRLLAQEGASARSAKDSAAAAGRAYDKLKAQLGPLLGTAGVDALFLRSGKVAGLASLGRDPAVWLASSAKLRGILRTLAPASAARAAEALFGTFLSLTATFIGERLTQQALRRAWPALEQPAPTETKK